MHVCVPGYCDGDGDDVGGSDGVDCDVGGSDVGDCVDVGICGDVGDCVNCDGGGSAVTLFSQERAAESTNV